MDFATSFPLMKHTSSYTFSELEGKLVLGGFCRVFFPACSCENALVSYAGWEK